MNCQARAKWRPSKRLVILSLAVGILGGLAASGAHFYQYRQRAAPVFKSWLDLTERTAQDMEAAAACNGAEPQIAAQCIGAAARGARTALGAYTLARRASLWLQEHPGDRSYEEVRDAGLQAIVNGRAALVASVPVLRQMQEIAKSDGAERRSHVSEVMDMLNAAELGLHAPEVAKRQGEWASRVLGPAVQAAERRADKS